ncbi:response regulator [Terrimonas sp. NA20]|uniref:histidine kinase n=1 Tax=Terrimonas ginsenosidimutans TaxID=2908004 RepID=A0ABS9KXI9_9BACT|nr:hybrid sensor histidine kinase/response regulator transcription factor [Terrimonas ginsenosidimutans]MCG2616944.1 response regulator [Terrimonas ginsenosidimutans]
MRRLLHITTLLLFSVITACAQQPSFHHLTVENGLSQNAVLAISQDSQGFMWVGTSNGLDRFDGYRFKVYQSRPNDSTTLSSNNLLSLLNDSRKNLWIGTNNGLNKYLPGPDRIKRINTTDKKQLMYHCLYEDKKGNVWAGTNKGLYKINTVAGDKPEIFDFAGTGKPDSWGIRAILEDRSGNFWIGTTTGLFRLSKSGSTTELTSFYHDPKNPNSISSDFITAIEEDRQGRIWAGTHMNGLNQYDSRSNLFKRIQHQSSGQSIINNNIRKILVDKEGRLWVGTQEGISLIDQEGKLLQSFQQDDNNPESLSQNSVHCLYEDNSGNMWAGTYFGGLNFTYAVNTQFSVLKKKDQPDFLNNNVISSIVEDEKKNLWIGTEGGGLNYYDRATGKFRVYKHSPTDPGSLGSNLVKIVYRDWQGQIWAGTHGGGLNLFDPVKNEFRRFLFKQNDAVLLNEEVLSVFEDGKGRFWVGTTFGIKLFNKIPQGLEPVNNPFTARAPFNSTANAFFEDDKHRLWVCTSDGLYLLEGDQFRKISGDLVNCIQQDKQSQVWFGIQQGGLGRYDEQTQKPEYVNHNGKISNRNILGILEDNQQNLWLSSDNGLFKFNPRQDLLQLFTASDGLAGNAFNYNSYFRDSKGEFFFGGFNGITHFFPDRIQSNQKAGKMAITGLKLFNHTIEPGDSTGLLKENASSTSSITLKYDQNVLSIEFALLNFIKSNKNAYAYKLEGYDKDWLYTNIPTATYTNLPSGDFRFVVKGANNDGVWSEVISTRVSVLPPFWLSWWAYCIYALAIGGIVFVVLRYFFLGALLKKEEELHQVKLNFFTNISHEIRTHLTLIMAPVERILETEDTSSFFRQQLNSVKQNANRLLRLVNELMDFRKAETGNLKLTIHEYDLIPLLEEVYDSFRDITIKKGITTSFLYEGSSLPLYFDREQLEKVFFNLMTNAIKFTPENGHIWLQVKEREKDVTISVTDDGRGIAPEYLDKVFTNFFQVDDHGHQNTGYGVGLALSKTIVTLHKGEISAESGTDAATGDTRTSFSVTLQKSNKHFTQESLKGARQLQHDQHAKQTGLAIKLPESGTEVSARPSILIVEDNPELRALVKETFGNHYRVLEAPNGEDALDLATTQLPDLVISDVMMPKMDGIEFCYRLKTDERTSHIPVILLTAKTTQNDQVTGLETGADMYLTKPFSTKILELNVRNLLAAREKLKQLFLQQVSTYTVTANEHPAKITALNSVEQEFLQKVIQIVEENMDNPDFGVDMLSRKVAMSAPVLYKKIKAVSKMSVNDFVKSLRLKKAAQLLQEKRLTVYEVAYAVGYSDRKYFSQEFKKQFGKTPSEYAQGNEGTGSV